MTNKVDMITEERGKRYGDFRGHATVTQAIKSILRDALADNEMYHEMTASDRGVLHEGLDMIALKLGRIVNGDPTYDDSWDDISGYVKITRDRICVIKGE